MPIFISYNHTDKDFAESLAKILVQAKQNVWIDTWELNAGDSLIERIEGALGDADAILVILSENSVKSEWCKKELRSGLVRELEEKSVIVIPIVLDDCEIPLFLKEKLWVDFRKHKDEQLDLLLRSLDKISNPSQGRFEVPDNHIDWSMTVVEYNGEKGVEWTFVNHGEKFPYVIMTQVLIWPEDSYSNTFSNLSTDEECFILAAEWINAGLKEEDFKILISSSQPERINRTITNSENKDEISVIITVRRLGEDNGMDTLVYAGNFLQNAIKHTLGTVRKPN